MTKPVEIVLNEGRYGLCYSVKRCSKCFLSDQFPEISFDNNGICSYCATSAVNSVAAGPTDSISSVYSRICNTDAPFDVVHLFSGGKDSTFALSQLVAAGFRVRALTYDNGFIAPETFRNIEKTARILNVECVTRRLNSDMSKQLLKEGFNGQSNMEALKYSTASCGLCISTVLRLGATEANSLGVKYLSGGWTPGQFTYDSIVDGSFIETVCHEHFDNLELRNPLLVRKLDDQGLTSSKFPSLFNPLYVTDYQEEIVLEHLHEMGWVRPARMDSCSSNCLLNGYLVLDHTLKHGFHPYEFELAHHVRTGRMSREEAISKVENVAVPISTVELVQLQLELTDKNSLVPIPRKSKIALKSETIKNKNGAT